MTIRHALGESTIAAEPTRVIAVNDGEALDHLLAVGVIPVLFGQTPGYDGTGSPSPWAEEAGGGKAEHYDMSRGEPDLERMTAGNPDLIVGAWIPEEQYTLMARIAPTIIIKDDDATAWPEMQRMVGKATGREQEAEDALAATDRVIADGKAQLAKYADRKVTIAYKFFDDLFIHGTNTPIARLVERLGLAIEGPVANELTTVSMERIGDLASADLLLSPWFFPDDQAAFEADPLTLALPAVKEGRYVPLPLDVAEAGYVESTLSVRWVIPKLVEALLTAAEGRGTKLS